MDQRLQKRRETSKLRSARHRARQKGEWEDRRKEAQELRQRVVVSEQKLEMVLGYLLNNDPELWCSFDCCWYILAGNVEPDARQ